MPLLRIVNSISILIVNDIDLSVPSNFGQVSFLCYIVLHCIYTHVLPPCVAPSCAQYTDKMVETCILVYNVIITQLLPTPAKSHYTFNLRDLSKVFQGMLMMEQGKIEVHPQSLQTSV